MVTKDDCQQLGLTWENKEYNFDNLARVRFIPRILVCLFLSLSSLHAINEITCLRDSLQEFLGKKYRTKQNNQ